jgi:Ferritin-like domain
MGRWIENTSNLTISVFRAVRRCAKPSNKSGSLAIFAANRRESMEEMQHADKLIARIIFLDAMPNGGAKQREREDSPHRTLRAAWKQIHLHEVLLITRAAASELEFEQQSVAW